nr:hypothetical protein HK105_006411 [Polyrhizophydium stewartii]
MKRLPSTFGELLDQLEVSTMSREAIEEELCLHMHSLSLALDAYRPPSAESRSLVRANKVEVDGFPVEVVPDSVDFVLSLSDELDLDEAQTAAMMQTCIRADLRLSATLRRVPVVDDAVQFNDETRALVREHYFQERLACLRVISALFRIAQDPSHNFHALAVDACKALYSGTVLTEDTAKPLYQRLLDQLLAAGRASVPSRFLSETDLALAWASQNLEEQIALADALGLVFYETTPCSAQIIETVFRAMHEFSFGADQPNRSFFAEVQHERNQLLNHLCNVVACEVFRFEAWIDFGRKRVLFDDPADMDHIPSLVTAVDKIVWASLRMPHLPSSFNATACLSWAVFQHLLLIRAPTLPSRSTRDFLAALTNSASVSDQSPHMLVQYAYTTQGVFESLLQSLNQSPYAEGSGNHKAFKSIIKGLMMAFFTTQNVASLPKRHVLVACMSKLLADDGDMCQQFWDEDYAVDERRSLLDSTRRRFPLECSDFLELMSSLIASPKTATLAFRYLCEITSFADLKRDGYEQAPDGAFSDRFVWTGGPLVGGTRSAIFAAQAGTPARSTGHNTLLLNMRYSAWHLFEALLESFLSHPGQLEDPDESGPLTGTSKSTLAILKLLSTFFSHATKDTVRALMQHMAKQPTRRNEHAGLVQPAPEERLVALLSSILDRVCLQRVPDLDLVTYCITTLRLLLGHFPTLVWRHIRSQMLLPQYSTSPWAAQQPSTSYMQRTILPLERSLGSYKATIAFLELFKNLIEDAQGTLQSQLGEDDETSGLSLLDDEVLNPEDPMDLMANTSLAYIHSIHSMRAPHSLAARQTDGHSSAAHAASAFSAGDQTSKTEVLLSIVSFLIFEIFPTHRSWRYQSIADKFCISSHILVSFNMILGNVCWANAAAAAIAAAASRSGAGAGAGVFSAPTMLAGALGGANKGMDSASVAAWSAFAAALSASTSVAATHALLTQAFLQPESVQHIAALLDIAATGNEALGFLHRQHRGSEARQLEASVRYSLKLLCYLMARRPELSLPSSALQSMLLDRTVKRAPHGTMDLVHVIGRYVFYEPDRQLSRQAIDLLTLLCEATSTPDSKSVSFVGCFGKDAQPLVASLIRIAQRPVTASSHHAALQDSVLCFATAALKSQPGLAAMLLATDSHSAHQLYRTLAAAKAGTASDASKAKAEEQSVKDRAAGKSIVHAIIDLISDWKTSVFRRPFALLSAIRLLDLLWQTAPDHRSTLGQIRQSKALWGVLRDIIFATVASVSKPPRAGGDDDGDEADMGEDSVLWGRRQQLNACLLDSMRAFALRIVALEGFFALGIAGVSDIHQATIRGILADAFASPTVFEFAFTSEPFPLGPNSVSIAQSLAEKTEPAVDLSLYCLPKSTLLVQQARLGSRYMFDTDLLARQFMALDHTIEHAGRQSSSSPASAIAARTQLLERLVRLNWEWSQADSRMLLVQSVRFAVEIVCLRLWAQIWSPAGQPPATLTADSHALRLITGLAKVLKQDQRTDAIVLRYRAVVAGMLRVLVAAWLRSKAGSYERLAPAQQQNGQEQLVAEHLNIIGMIQGVLTATSPFDLGPAGVFSSFEFHMELLLSLLLVLRSLNKLARRAGDSTESSTSNMGGGGPLPEARVVETCSPLIPFLCQGLSFVLSADLASASSVHLRVGLAVMIELLQRGELRPSLWLAAFDRFQVLPLLLNVVAKADAATLHGHWESFDIVLRTLLCLSFSLRFAERLAVAGILTAFAGSAFASHMSQGAGAGEPTPVAARMFQSWGLVLSILTQLLDALGHNQQFSQELVGVVQLFLKYLLWTFERVLTEPLTMDRLEELERASELLFSLVQMFALGIRSRAPGSPLRQHEPILIAAIQDASLRVVALFSHLFMSPFELASLSSGGAGGQPDPMAPSDDETLAQRQSFVASMRRISRNLIMILISTTSAEECLIVGSEGTTGGGIGGAGIGADGDYAMATQGHAYDGHGYGAGLAGVHQESVLGGFGVMALLPKMASLRGESSSFGTLFNLIRRTLAHIESQSVGAGGAGPGAKQPGSDASRADASGPTHQAERDVCVQVIEGSLLLILAQLLVLQEYHDDVGEIAAELVQTLDELKQLLGPALRGKPAAGRGPTDANPLLVSAESSLEFVTFLRKICERRVLARLRG